MNSHPTRQAWLYKHYCGSWLVLLLKKGYMIGWKMSQLLIRPLIDVIAVYVNLRHILNYKLYWASGKKIGPLECCDCWNVSSCILMSSKYVNIFWEVVTSTVSSVWVETMTFQVYRTHLVVLFIVSQRCNSPEVTPLPQIIFDCTTTLSAFLLMSPWINEMTTRLYQRCLK